MEDPSIDRFRADLRDMGDRFEDTDVPDGKALELLGSRARAAARKVSGFMAGSITVRGKALEADAEYAPIVHEGWRGITPNPFMTDATDANVATPYEQHAEESLRGEIRTRY